MRALFLPMTVLAVTAGITATALCGHDWPRTTSTSAVVTVNGRSLTNDQFDSFLQVKLGEFGRERLTDRVKSELLDEFVAREVTLQDAGAHGLLPPASVSAGPVPDKLLDEMTIDRVVQRYYREVVLKDVAVSDEELEAHLALLAGSECLETGYVVREICVPSRDEAEAARQKVLSGAEPFEQVARVMSRTPTAPRGGLSYYDPGVLPPALERAVKPLSPGEISRIVETGYGFHIFRLERRATSPTQDGQRDRVAEEVLASKNERLVRANGQRLLEGASVSVNRDVLPFEYKGRFAGIE